MKAGRPKLEKGRWTAQARTWRHILSLAFTHLCRTYATVVLIAAALPLNAAVHTVTSLADIGSGTLRDAVASSSGGDTIQFAVNGTIVLNGAIVIDHALHVQGPGPAKLSVDGGGVDRVFLTGNPILLSGMTITNGFVMGTNGDNGPFGVDGQPGGEAIGGAILATNSSLVVISNCWVTGNTAKGGRGGDGGSNPFGDIFTPANGGQGGRGWAGAVEALSNININCTFSQNRAIGGQGGDGGDNLNPAVGFTGGTGGAGGEAISGALKGNRIDSENCTFSGNLVVGGAGGKGGYNTNGFGGTGGAGGSAQAGALHSVIGYFMSCTIVSNSAFAGNAGSGGGGSPPGASGAAGSGTVGGVVGYTFGPCVHRIGNTILADNYADTSLPNFYANFNDLGYNFIGTDDKVVPCGFGPSTMIGTISTPIHPQLRPLAHYGAGLPTHPPVYPTSPVIDVGKSFGLTTDERGAPRPYDFNSIANAGGGDASDIGAFELGTTNLGMGQFSNNVVVSWPAHYGDFKLQSSTDLLGSNNWSDVPDTPVVVDDQFVVTNPMTNAAAFYRLVTQ